MPRLSGLIDQLACLLLTLLIFNPAFSYPIQDHRIDTAALSKFASSLGISEEADLIEETQKHWIRKCQERWEMEELSPDQKELVLSWAMKQGLFSSWKPLCKAYDEAIILGGNTEVMKKRLNYLKDCWNEGIRFEKITWLTGDRPLNKNVDDFLGRARNESEAVRIIQHEIPLPKELSLLPVVFIALPMKEEDSSLKRPNTEDTIIEWLKIKQKSRKVLFISNQPFCGYQFAVINTNLPQDIQFDVCGPGIDPKNYPNIAAITLDSIARWIYQDHLQQSEKN